MLKICKLKKCKTPENLWENSSVYFKIGRIFLEARETGEDPFDAVESVISWEALAQSISEAKNLTAKQNFDSLYFISD